MALAGISRNGTLYGTEWHRETIGLFQPSLNLNYLILDFGQRSGAINEAKAELLAADFAFNDTHRKIIYQVTASYYRLLNAMGQQDAAQATLFNAQTVEKDTQSRSFQRRSHDDDPPPAGSHRASRSSTLPATAPMQSRFFASC